VGNNPTNRGTLGTTRSLLTDGQGLPLGVAVDGAHRHAMKLVEATLEAIMIKRPEPTATQPQHLCLDKGYDDAAVRETRAAGEVCAPRLPGAPLGGRADARLDEPLSAAAHPVGEEGGDLSRAVAFRVCLDHLLRR
jgi:hypothetical protein